MLTPGPHTIYLISRSLGFTALLFAVPFAYDALRMAPETKRA